jgi:hypothetical protein
MFPLKINTAMHMLVAYIYEATLFTGVNTNQARLDKYQEEKLTTSGLRNRGLIKTVCKQNTV